MINCICEHFQRIKSSVFCFRSRMQYTFGRITNRAFPACKIPLKLPKKTAMQNVLTLFLNDVKLSFVKTTKFIVQFSQTFNFQCRDVLKPYSEGKNTRKQAIFKHFPGYQKLDLTAFRHRYINNIFRKKK